MLVGRQTVTIFRKNHPPFSDKMRRQYIPTRYYTRYREILFFISFFFQDMILSIHATCAFDRSLQEIKQY
jgi:hypothetical protein